MPVLLSELIRTGGKMKKWKSRVLFHGGSIPIPSYYQKGKIEIKADVFEFKAGAKVAKYNIDIRFPLTDIYTVKAKEKKYYSSTAYMLIIEYKGQNGSRESLELEIRSFGRRGRAQAIARLWADRLTSKA